MTLCKKQRNTCDQQEILRLTAIFITKFFAKMEPQLAQKLPELHKEYQIPFSSQPIYPDLLYVEQGKEAFSTRLLVKKSFKMGGIVCKILGATTVKIKNWMTVQVSKTEHVELNSELVYLVSHVN
jgi:hypothetical protein